MPKPACVACQRFMRPKTNGFPVIEGMPDGNDVPPGLEAAERWRPYKLWVCDKWWCPTCGVEILAGYSGGPVAEHYQDDFPKMVARLGATLQINDC